MAQEEKSLLLQDLCARLPYGVKSKSQASHLEINTIDGYFVDGDGTKIFHLSESDIWQEVEHFQYYLRPMSSMTEEEREELSDYLCEKVMSNKIGITIPPNPTQGKGIPFIWIGDCIDWLNEHHFDYRGLIPMGLALEAPEGMYNF